MKLTVQTAVSDRPVVTEALEPWANREVRPVLARLRDAANYTGRERNEVVTAGDGVPVTIWESAVIPDDCTWSIHVRVVACPEAAGGSTYIDVWHTATVLSRGGTITSGQSSLWFYAVGIPPVSFTVDTTERKVRLVVADDGAAIHRFVAVVDHLEGREA